MKHKWWLVPIALAVIGVLWILANDKAYLEPLQTAVGLKPASVERAKSKPICSSPVNPNVAAPIDCVPQHLANLPPDPGPAGLRTIEGIDSDKDGVRDDVQRFIALNYGHSERAVQTLRNIAKSTQLAVLKGDSVSREEAQKLAPIAFNAGACYSRVADQQIQKTRALELVEIQVTNTPERFKRAKQFEYKSGHHSYVIPDASTKEVCGFDPSALPN